MSLDYGRFRETGIPADKFAFHTPPLHNLAIIGPWMHDGAFSNLRSVIAHHLNLSESLRGYETAVHLPPAPQNTFQNDPALLDEMLSGVDPLLAPSRPLTQAEVAHLVAF